MVNSFDFTIAIAPKDMNLKTEMGYIKSSLLYADKISLISPTAFLLCQLMDDSKKTDDKNLIRLIQKILPLYETANPSFFAEASPRINRFAGMIFSKAYRNIPILKKIEISEVLKGFASDVSEVMIGNVGSDTYSEIVDLIQMGKLNIQKFDNPINNSDECVKEFFRKLKDSVLTSYPLFDELSSNLMRAATSSGIITLSPISKFRATHSGLTENIICRLPAFDFATVDEILDVRKELDKYLARFRSKLLKYTDEIHSLPWEADFASECQILYDKELVPSILDINEMCNDASFLKNFGKSIFCDKNLLRSAGGILIAIAASGVIDSFSNAVVRDTSILTAGTAWAISQVASSYFDYQKDVSAIKRNDLYFYYKSADLLKK